LLLVNRVTANVLLSTGNHLKERQLFQLGVIAKVRTRRRLLNRGTPDRLRLCTGTPPCCASCPATVKIVWLLLLTGLLIGCQKQDPLPEVQLPPATQTGANTFGCLVNGQAWTPQGYTGSSNYSVYYDRTYRNGTLNVAAYRYEPGDQKSRQDIILFSDSIAATGTYPLTIRNHQEALFYGNATQCEFQQNGNHYRRGTLTITRLDLQAGIVSGTFAFTLYKPGCDSVRVTNGRFDKRL